MYITIIQREVWKTNFAKNALSNDMKDSCWKDAKKS